MSGSFKKLIDRQLQLFSFLHGVFTHVPTMIVQPYKVVTETLFSNGIQATWYGFAKRGLAFSIQTLEGTQTSSVFIAGKHAIFVVHNRGHEVAISIGINNALLVYLRLSLCRKLAPAISVTSSRGAISSKSTGAPASPSIQQIPLQASKSQQKHSVIISDDNKTFPTCIIDIIMCCGFLYNKWSFAVGDGGCFTSLWVYSITNEIVIGLWKMVISEPTSTICRQRRWVNAL